MFHEFTLKDAAAMRERAPKSGVCSSEFNGACAFAWAKRYNTEFADLGDSVALRFCSGGVCLYTVSAEGAAFPAAFEAAASDARAHGRDTLRLICFERQLKLLRGDYTYEAMEGSSDYVYDADKLIALPGSEYHAKRNFIAQFKRANEWRFEPVSEENAADCERITELWNEARDDKSDYHLEREAIDRILSNRAELGVTGGVLYAYDKPAAFTLGSLTNPDTLDVIIEKALPDIKGAYAVINNEFLKYMRSLCAFGFVNREEDLGIENMRRAKLSYRPIAFVDRFLAKIPIK